MGGRGGSIAVGGMGGGRSKVGATARSRRDTVRGRGRVRVRARVRFRARGSVRFRVRVRVRARARVRFRVRGSRLRGGRRRCSWSSWSSSSRRA